MPYHYKKFSPGTPEYKKAYSEHLIKKLKKKRKRRNAGSQARADSGFLPPDPAPGGTA